MPQICLVLFFFLNETCCFEFEKKIYLNETASIFTSPSNFVAWFSFIDQKKKIEKTKNKILCCFHFVFSNNTYRVERKSLVLQVFFEFSSLFLVFSSKFLRLYCYLKGFFSQFKAQFSSSPRTKTKGKVWSRLKRKT